MKNAELLSRVQAEIADGADSGRKGKQATAKVLHHPTGVLGRLQKDIKTGRLSVPAMRYEGEKIMYALDLCAKHYPKLPIPYTYLCMLVAGLSAVPKADGTKTQELRRRVSGNNKAMQKKYKRTIISLPKEQAVRASVDGEDVFNWSGVRAVKGALTAIQRAQEIETLFDVSTIKKTDANAENLEWYKALSPLLTRVSKQAPALPSGEAAKPDAKPKKK